MKLVIISHTEHFQALNGDIMGWGSTVLEINHLTELFDKIYHVAPLYSGLPPASSISYNNTNIEFIPLHPGGGKSFREKIRIITSAPFNLWRIHKTLNKGDIFQFRAPTAMGVYVIPYLTLFSNKRGWFKYATNWITNRPSRSSSFQRWWLKNINKRLVTINGNWPSQESHCLAFENPCLTEQERAEGKNALKKDYKGKLNFIFVGRLEDAKGVNRIINAFEQLNSVRIGTVHIVGDGAKKEEYQKYVKEKPGLRDLFKFHGFISKNDLPKLLKQCHILLLPSDSEGFPKVVAEGANYGCVPVVSDVSSLSQYIIEDETGFIMPTLDTSGLIRSIQKCFCSDLNKISQNAYEMAGKFTYEKYKYNLKQKVLGLT